MNQYPNTPTPIINAKIADAITIALVLLFRRFASSVIGSLSDGFFG
jgi:hypothetical protein